MRRTYADGTIEWNSPLVLFANTRFHKGRYLLDAFERIKDTVRKTYPSVVSDDEKAFLGFSSRLRTSKVRVLGRARQGQRAPARDPGGNARGARL